MDMGQKRLKKMPKKQPKILNFNITKKCLSFDRRQICFLKRFPTAMHFGKMSIRHLFRYGQLLFLANKTVELAGRSQYVNCVKVRRNVYC